MKLQRLVKDSLKCEENRYRPQQYIAKNKKYDYEYVVDKIMNLLKKYGFFEDEGCYLYYNKKRTTVFKGMD